MNILKVVFAAGEIFSFSKYREWFFMNIVL